MRNETDDDGPVVSGGASRDAKDAGQDGTHRKEGTRIDPGE